MVAEGHDLSNLARQHMNPGQRVVLAVEYERFHAAEKLMTT
jgi:hypothetical protein